MGNVLQGPATEAGPGINELDDALLGSIFAIAGGLELGPSVTLVCRRWQRVFYAEPSIWSTFQLVPGPALLRQSAPGACRAWLGVQYRLLQRVAPAVATLVVRDSWCSDTASPDSPHLDTALALSLLSAPACTGLVLRTRSALADAAVQQVATLSRLTALQLSTPQVTPGTAAALGTLHNLRALRLDTAALPDGACASLSRLGSLTLLDIEAPQLPAGLAAVLTGLAGQLHTLCLRTVTAWHCGRAWGPQPEPLDEATIAAIYHCTALKELSLVLAKPLPPTALDSLPQLHHLRRLVVQAPPSQQPLALPVLAQLASLEAFDVGTVSSVDGPSSLGGLLQAPDGSRLRRCCLESAAGDAGGPAPAASLLLAGLRGLPDLQGLLCSLVPAGAALSSLQLADSRLPAEALAERGRTSALRCLGLRRLRLANCGSGLASERGGQVDAALDALSTQAPLLEELCIERGWLLPAAGWHSRWRRLRRLELRSVCVGGDLPDLTQGFEDLTAGLEELVFDVRCSDPLPRLPPALAAATALHSLTVFALAQLRHCDIREVLSCLPRLRRLHLPFAGVPAGVRAHLLLRQPQLELTGWAEDALRP
ncbi:hypothetical protein ABPG75_006345 [Micractinium tetrahymenae]